MSSAALDTYQRRRYGGGVDFGSWRVEAERCADDQGIVGSLARSLVTACDLLERPRVWLDVGDPTSTAPTMRCSVHGLTFMASDGRCRHGSSGPADCPYKLEPNFGTLT